MIQVIYLLSLLASGLAVKLEVNEDCPSCVVFDSACYNISHVLDLDAPFRNEIVIHKLGLLRTENVIFFSFEPVIEDIEYFKIGFVDLDNHNISGVISSQNQVLNFGAFDIDQDNSLIYIGGSDGIFRLDTNQNTLSSFSSRGDVIKSIFFKNNVNFAKEGEPGITVKKGDNFGIFMETTLVDKFVINNYDVVTFTNSSGLFVGKREKGVYTIHMLSINPFFRGLNIDMDGVVYAWWLDGIYKVVIEKNVKDSRITKVASVPLIGSLTFDNQNNILFTSGKSLFRMTSAELGCTIMNT